MAKLITGAKWFLVEDDAATMMEYGLLITLIALVVAIAAAFVGSQVSAFFQNAGNSFT